jgi:hypothetical protein
MLRHLTRQEIIINAQYLFYLNRLVMNTFSECCLVQDGLGPCRLCEPFKNPGSKTRLLRRILSTASHEQLLALRKEVIRMTKENDDLQENLNRHMQSDI